MSKTEPPYYPENWSEIASDLKNSIGECQNCRKPKSETVLEVHHVVPVSRGGSHNEENLRVLCRKCHEATHNEDEMAPVVEFFTGWKIPDEDFEVFRNYIKSTEMRPHGGDGYYIPLGDLREKVGDNKKARSEEASPMLDELDIEPERVR
jgi:hypothetical protein